MPPRSMVPRLLLPACVLALLLAAWSATGSMMAVDLGSEFIKVALIKPGRTPIAVVVNEMSKRKSPALVGVVGGERLLGEEALSLAVRHPESIFQRAVELLGMPASDPALQQALQRHNLPYKLVAHGSRGTAALAAKDGGVYSAEELVVGGAGAGGRRLHAWGGAAACARAHRGPQDLQHACT